MKKHKIKPSSKTCNLFFSIIVTPMSGEHIGGAIANAEKYAKEIGRDILLEFNGRLIKVPKDGKCCDFLLSGPCGYIQYAPSPICLTKQSH